MSRPRLPTGTVTILFSDIEQSTRLLGDLGSEAFAEALAAHRRVVRQSVRRHGGVEVDTAGDAFFVAFPTADGALAAAGDIQRGLRDGPIRLRIGLHTGRPHVAPEGYVGLDVHRGARIAAAAHGGQVLISATTRAALTTDSSPLTELGEHRLKDFATPVGLYQLGDDAFPPLRTVSNTNLPRPVSAFIGREREVTEVAGLLRGGARLLTLTGPGGAGKTRLAIECAAELVGVFRAGVFWVPLAALRDATLVADAIAATIGATDGLARQIGERDMLLVLDNLEQLLVAGPELASLVEACPRLHLLLTSRERLRVRGERGYVVPPLPTADAVALFAERSGLTPDASMRELVARLDDLPLAIELAAARTNALSPAEILQRMSSRLDLLKGGRDAEPRQHTLRATIEWSHELLDPREQQLFARLAVFRGGCSLDAAEQIIDADVDLLGRLVDKSLLARREERFVMLETVSRFALEKLDASGEATAVRRRHAEWFLALAEQAYPNLRGSDAATWFERLQRENDNLRAALDHFEAVGDFDDGLRMAGALGRFWATRNFNEGRRRLERLLSLADRAPRAARLNALVALGVLAGNAGAHGLATDLHEEAIAVAEAIGDRAMAARSRMNLGALAADVGDFERAREVYSRSVAEFDELGDEFFAGWARRMMAWMEFELGDATKATALYEDLLQRARSAGNEWLQAASLGALGEYAILDGRLADGLVYLEESIRLYEAMGDLYYLAADLMRLGHALAIAGDRQQAARSLGAADALCAEIGAKSWIVITEFRRTVALVRGELDDAGWERALDEGRRLRVQDAIRAALDTLRAALDTHATASPDRPVDRVEAPLPSARDYR